MTTTTERVLITDPGRVWDGWIGRVTAIGLDPEGRMAAWVDLGGEQVLFPDSRMTRIPRNR